MDRSSSVISRQQRLVSKNRKRRTPLIYHAKSKYALEKLKGRLPSYLGNESLCILFKEGTINQENVKAVNRSFRKRILRSEFNRMKKKLMETDRCPYLNVSEMQFGTMYTSFTGGKTHSEIHGAKIAAWLAANSYYTYSKTNPEADCVICGKKGDPSEKKFGGDNWIHYVSGYCSVVEEKLGYLWIGMLEKLMLGPRHPIQALAWRIFPRTKLMYLIDPNNDGLGSYKLSCLDERFTNVLEFNRMLLFAIHQLRTTRDVGLKIMGKIVEVKVKKKLPGKQKKSKNGSY